jgi:hypothetical protein
MGYVDASLSSASSTQQKIPIALNYDFAVNVGSGTQNAGNKSSLDAGSDIAKPQAVSAQGGPASLNDSGQTGILGGLTSASSGGVSIWLIVGIVGALVLGAVAVMRR